MKNTFERSRPPFPNPNIIPHDNQEVIYSSSNSSIAETLIKSETIDRPVHYANPSAPDFNHHLDKITETHEKAEQKQAIENEKKNLKNIFQSGDEKKIMDFLLREENPNLTFRHEIERVKKQYSKELGSANFLNYTDWKILTGLELFDKYTFEHSVGTYLILKNWVENQLVELGMDVKKEGVQFEQLYRAALFHDVGKMTIPNFLLTNRTTDEQWVMHLTEIEDQNLKDDIFMAIHADYGIAIPEEIRDDLEKMTIFFKEKRIRAVKYVPIGQVLSENQKSELNDMHFSDEEKNELLMDATGNLKSACDLPLGKIMQLHESRSQEMLEEFGYFVEGLLAGHHHNYKHKDTKLGEKPTSLTLTHLSIETASNLLHLADINNALNTNRSYHLKNPMLRILAFMVDDANRGSIDPEKTAKVIFSELKKMSPAYLIETRNLLAKRQHHEYILDRQKELEAIDEFLYDNLPESDDYHFDLAA